MTCRACGVVIAFAISLNTALLPPAHGQFLSPDFRVSPSDGLGASNPAVALAGERALFIWERERNCGICCCAYVSRLGAAFTMDGGATWQLAPELPFAEGSQVIGIQPAVCALNDSTFYSAATFSQSGATIAVWRGVATGAGLTWDSPVPTLPIRSFTGLEMRPYETPALAADPATGNLYLAVTSASQVWNGTYYDYQYHIVFTRSMDGGLTWQSSPVVLSGAASQGPQVIVGPEGEVYVLWVDYATSRFVGRKSMNSGANFGPEFAVAVMNDNIGTLPAGYGPTLDRRNPRYPTLSWLMFSTYPSVAVDRSNGARRGSLYVTWAEHGAGTVANGTGFVGDPEPNDTPETAAEVEIGQDFGGFAQGKFEFDCDSYRFEGDTGTTIWMSGTIGLSPPSDQPQFRAFGLLCEQDQTSVYSATAHWMPESQYGPGPPTIYALPRSGQYRLPGPCGSFFSISYNVQFRRFDILPGESARDHRDIVLVSSSDGGLTWSPKVRVNDDPSGHENTFSSVAVDGFGQVHVAWYDRRDDPTCAQRVHTYWAMSQNGGQAFLPSRRLSSQSGSWFEASGSSNIGDHLGIAASGSKVHVLWTDVRAGVGDADIWAATIDADPATPVAVAAFAGEAREGSAHLRWQVVDGRDLIGFRVHRAQEGQAEVAIGAGRIMADHEGEFTFEDADVEPGDLYRYRLEVEHASGDRTWFGPIEVRVPSAITRLTWERMEPNPFSDRARLTLAAPRAAWATVRVFDLLGHEVRTLHRGPVGAGRNVWEWDGMDRSSGRAAPGVYLVRAEFEGEVATRRLVLVR